jgi:hypothetical protein
LLSNHQNILHQNTIIIHFFPPGNILQHNIFTFLLQFLKLCTTNIWMPMNLTLHTKGSFAERTTGFLNLLSWIINQQGWAIHIRTVQFLRIINHRLTQSNTPPIKHLLW